MMTSAVIVRSFASLLFVIGLLLCFVWAMRRGVFRKAGGSRASIVVETAVSLGERRSVVIVAVEGRRLLLGLATGGVSLLADLAPVKTDGGVL
jgi:flagellar biogenesis protein FliO